MYVFLLAFRVFLFVSWLQVQWNLLMEQQACNVWRKNAFWSMKSAHDQFGKESRRAADRLLACLDTFRERVDHSVENSVPVGQVSRDCGQSSPSCCYPCADVQSLEARVAVLMEAESRYCMSRAMLHGAEASSLMFVLTDVKITVDPSIVLLTPEILG